MKQWNCKEGMGTGNTKHGCERRTVSKFIFVCAKITLGALATVQTYQF